MGKDRTGWDRMRWDRMGKDRMVWDGTFCPIGQLFSSEMYTFVATSQRQDERQDTFPFTH